MSEKNTNIILCEGETDAILLSYYMEKMYGWKYSRKSPSGLDIRTNKSAGETANWYKVEDKYLLICAVGGVSNFKRFFTEKIKEPLRQTDMVSKLAFVVDRDDRTIQEIEGEFSGISPIVNKLKNNRWVEGQYENGYGEIDSLGTLLLVIPRDVEGALETVLLDAIADHSPVDKCVVDESKAFIENIAPKVEEYLKKPRMQLKAKLGVTFAVQSPQKVFTFIDDQIRSIDWESEVLKETFEQLKEI